MPRKQNTVDFMIVGQGLAGSILAWRLIKQGVSVLVIDDQHKDASSVVAAGIINPITGHRLNITNDIECFLPNALLLYKEMEQCFQASLIKALPQLRLIKKQGQLDYWHKRKQQPSHQPYLGLLHNEHDTFLENAFGIAEIKQTYRVDTGKLLSHCREWLVEQGALLNQRFDHASLNNNDEGVEYCGHHAKGIVFCEGFQAIHNPLWQHLPFKLAKGEILTLESSNLTPSMLNWGSWVLPINSPQSTSKKGLYKLGSNYVWNDTSANPNNDVKEQLLTSMHDKVAGTSNVVNHQVGIRPTTLHRQAFVGEHPEHKRVFCFNGFGSKGCLTIPFHADLLTQHVTKGAALPETITQYL